MANPSSTLYRFRIELSDVDRSVYESLDFRVSMHPSETLDYLLTRVLAYVLNYDAGLEILPGLCVGDEPALQLKDSQGGIELWIDIGNPSPRRIHRASKASRALKIFTYKDPLPMIREAQGEHIHRADEIEIHSLDSAVLKMLAQRLNRDNRWTLVRNDGELAIHIGDETVTTELTRHRLVV